MSHKTLIDSVNHEQKQIIRFAQQHGSYKADIDAVNYSDVKNLESLHILKLSENQLCANPTVRIFDLTLTGEHLAKEINK